ncbi:DUF222 domain-containing protein [Kineosporia sp. A_224]|uniref:DUF222 domain-containing protein n=1 Tax=Kineosporia sp. A_224 TaxID=1962180 RepID=UPI001179BD39|nr:DUF222 domain-containing protein [Kineosporia sp. A_224]
MTAQADWDAALASLYARVAADDRRAAVERRVVLDGVPGLGSFAASLEVLDGAVAWTPEQAGVEGFVDDLADGAISGFAAARRVEGHALWLQVAHAAVVVRAFTGRTPSLPRRTRSGRLLTDDQDVLVDGSVALELAVAAGVTQGKAAALVDAATTLVIDERLPLTARALREGLLDWARLRMVVTRTRALTLENARAVERLAYATDGVLDGGIRRFDTALTAAVLAVDADAEANRRRRNRKGRRVSIQTTDDGAALFTAVGPGEAVTAAYNGLDAAARYLRAHGDPRTLDQLRHDLFVTGCTTGYLPVPADVLPVPAGCVPSATPVLAPGPVATSATGPTQPSGTASRTGQAGATGPTGPTGAAGRTGAASRTGAAGPNGPMGSAARVDGAAGAEAAADESGPQWFTTTWPDVQVTVNVTVSAETLMGLVDDPGTLHGYGPIPADAIRDLVTNGVFRCLVVDGEHGTVLGVGKNTFSPGYVASERLKLLVEHAHPTCTAPHCTKASWRCDLDHAEPYAQGGATCSCNVRPLCRACHRLKTAGLLVPEQRNHPDDPPGTIAWTTRTGRTWTALPHAPLARPPDPSAPLSSLPHASTVQAEDAPPF